MYVHNLSPFLVQFGDGFGIRWYGVAYLLGFIALYYAALWLIPVAFPEGASNKAGLKELAGDFAFTIALGTVLGGRIGYCVLYDPELFLRFSYSFPFWGLLEVHKGGMASHGGIVGIILASLWFSRRHKLPALMLLDIAATAGTFGVFFGRIANFINGELVGRPCNHDLPWAVKFPQDIVSWPFSEPEKLSALSQVVGHIGISSKNWSDLITHPARYHVQKILYTLVDSIQNGNELVRASLAPLLTPRHPSQIYEALLEGALIFIVLVLLWRRHPRHGLVSAAFANLYAIVRIAGEQFRMPDAQIGFQLFGLTRGQWLSIVMFILSLIFIVRLYRRTDPVIPKKAAD